MTIEENGANRETQKEQQLSPQDIDREAQLAMDSYENFLRSLKNATLILQTKYDSAPAIEKLEQGTDELETVFNELKIEISEHKKQNQPEENNEESIKQYRQEIFSKIAHKINNALTGIYGYIELAQMQFPDDETIKQIYAERTKLFIYQPFSLKRT
ncbi:MAG: hypothetical protein CEN89_492 [Candidatus Berkelbacteria bacterium Licking1014_7]|uniref:Signal transduction histidine kinase dimerisation/phosphoacceptor domain-containing protein n=1 Tax=Candidatus Berkelbacteria bacterium Licking1014_7 TaxID=2017147 RepID=A0A554LIV0_9BACT|nr:MAG: hypothetical protein CEN89_492 [Candidatus Berkelbacteria bacterium Licking1014_7]